MSLHPKVLDFIGKLPLEIRPVITDAAESMVNMAVDELIAFLDELTVLVANKDIAQAHKTAYQRLSLELRKDEWDEDIETAGELAAANAAKIEQQRAIWVGILVSIIAVGRKILLPML